MPPVYEHLSPSHIKTWDAARDTNTLTSSAAPFLVTPGIPVGSDDILNFNMLHSVSARLEALAAANASTSSIKRVDHLKQVLLRGAPSPQHMAALAANASASPVVSGGGFPCAANWTRLWTPDFIAQGHRFVEVNNVLSRVKYWERPCKSNVRWRVE